ncbi:alpha/beta fold hydrolase [Streptomyces sp. NPDC004111]|uniref:alpha/beta fold hydrolase n=1 Tax=Streptomyces sp. NPDC004111 TaxID=3364690 RepID=UPI0036A91A38
MTQPRDSVPSSPLPVVFLHGTRVSRTMWEPVMDIVGAHRPVGAPDLPGHGARRGERFTLEGAVDAAAGAVDELGGRALLAGLSLGGYVAVATAARHPERTAGVLAIGCTALVRGAVGALYRRQAALAARYPEAADRLSRRAFRRTLPAPAAAAMGAGGLSSEVWADVMDALAGLDAPAALVAYPGPVWLANGSRDLLRSDERTFLAACRDGRLTVWPGHGHLSPLGDPPLLARAVLDAAVVAERTGEVSGAGLTASAVPHQPGVAGRASSGQAMLCAPSSDSRMMSA